MPPCFSNVKIHIKQTQSHLYLYIIQNATSMSDNTRGISIFTLAFTTSSTNMCPFHISHANCLNYVDFDYICLKM